MCALIPFIFGCLLKNQLEDFFIKPKVRFENMPGEQHTMFIKDPSNNFIEIKAFADQNKLFET